MTRKIALLADINCYRREVQQLEALQPKGFDFVRCPQMSQAIEVREKQKLDLAILFLNRFSDFKTQPIPKIKSFFGETPLLVYTRGLGFESRLEIVKIAGTFAMDSGEESFDLADYVKSMRFQSHRGRGFIRAERSRALEILWNGNTKFLGHFLDYSQTGARVKLVEKGLPVKSRVCLQYFSKATDDDPSKKLRKIESYVVWHHPSELEVGLQFLAVV